MAKDDDTDRAGAVAADWSVLTQQLMPLSWNIAVTRAMQSVTFPGLHELMRLISGFGNAPKVIAITALVLIASNKRRQAVFLTLCGLGGWLLAMQLKNLFGASRPDPDLVTVFHQWPDGSFPSGHLVFYVCYFGFLFFLAREHLPRQSVLRPLVLILIAPRRARWPFACLPRRALAQRLAGFVPARRDLAVLSITLYRRWRQVRKPQHDWFLPYRMTVK